MLFNSLEFLIFFPAVTLIYFIIPLKIKNTWLLICSYELYGMVFNYSNNAFCNSNLL